MKLMWIKSDLIFVIMYSLKLGRDAVQSEVQSDVSIEFWFLVMFCGWQRLEYIDLYTLFPLREGLVSVGTTKTNILVFIHS